MKKVKESQEILNCKWVKYASLFKVNDTCSVHAGQGLYYVYNNCKNLFEEKK